MSRHDVWMKRSWDICPVVELDRADRGTLETTARRASLGRGQNSFIPDRLASLHSAQSEGVLGLPLPLHAAQVLRTVVDGTSVIAAQLCATA